MTIKCPDCGEKIERKKHGCYYYKCSCGYEDQQYDTLDEKAEAEEHFKDVDPDVDPDVDRDEVENPE